MLSVLICSEWQYRKIQVNACEENLKKSFNLSRKALLTGPCDKRPYEKEKLYNLQNKDHCNNRPIIKKQTGIEKNDPVWNECGQAELIAWQL